MRKILVCWLALFAWEPKAPTIHLQGIVTNKAGKPVAKAIVDLKGLGLRDTTASGGTYSITNNGGSAIASSTPGFSNISLDNGSLVVALDNPSSIKVELFDMTGNLLKEHLLQNAGKGGYRFPLATSSRKSALLLVRVSIGRHTTSFHCLSLGTGKLVLVGSGSARATASVVDTLVTTAAGYTPGKLGITSYNQTANIVLDTATTAVRSAGCDKTHTLNNETHTLQSGGQTRQYILKAPASYDETQAYRLVFAFAELGSSAQSVADRNYFTMATYDTVNTIFAAPDAANGAGSWSNADVAFTDDILAQLEGDLCIDQSRIFASGFSFGGAMSMAIACTRADVFRGVAFFSGADLTGSCPTTLTKPIAYYASQASHDGDGMDITNPMTAKKKKNNTPLT